MSKKNLLADQLNAFSEGLKNTTPIKITPKVEITESEEVQEIPTISTNSNPKSNKNKKNKFKTGELVQMSIIIPRELQKMLKGYAFKNDQKVNSVILDGIEKLISGDYK
jgi:hypothetical protein